MYPLNLLNSNTVIHPIFGEQLRGEPHIFNFSSGNPRCASYDKRNFDVFQRQIMDELRNSGAEWGIGRYLEERRNLLSDYPQIVNEGRIYHLGLDIIVPPGYTLFAPIDGRVWRADIEEGVGNYGGFLILEHHQGDTVFYSFYGHLVSDHLVHEGDTVKGGDPIGIIGERENSGGWFTHTHLQILTERAIREGREMKGYISANDLPQLEQLFPSPYPLFRY